MRALTWQGVGEVSVETVADPQVKEPTDAVVRITSTAICGSDLHLLNVLAPYLAPGDVLGHEPMGIVEEVGAAVSHIRPGTPAGYAMFNDKRDGCVKVVLQP